MIASVKDVFGQNDDISAENIQEVNVINDTSHDPYVEMRLGIHVVEMSNGLRACEPITAEVFPHRHGNNGEKAIRILEKDRLDVDEYYEYKIFAATIARLVYHGD